MNQSAFNSTGRTEPRLVADYFFCAGRHKKNNLRDGFSLIEVMVAVSLLAVIIVGLLAMFFQTQRAFRAGLAQSDVMEGGRAAIELLVRELAELTASRMSNMVNFQALLTGGEVQDLPGDPPARTNELFDLRFLTRENDIWTGTAYRINHLATDGSSLGAGTLYRFQAKATNAPRTFLIDLLGPVNQAVNQVQLDDLTARAPEFYGLRRVIDGVVHFRVRAFDERGYLVVTNTPSQDIVFDPGIEQRFSGTQVPASVEVELGILEPKAFESFQARPDNQKVAFLAGQAGKVHLFRQRVPIRHTDEK